MILFSIVRAVFRSIRTMKRCFDFIKQISSCEVYCGISDASRAVHQWNIIPVEYISTKLASSARRLAIRYAVRQLNYENRCSGTLQAASSFSHCTASHGKFIIVCATHLAPDKSVALYVASWLAAKLWNHISLQIIE